MIDKFIKQDTKVVWVIFTLLVVFCWPYISDDIVTLRKLEGPLLMLLSIVRISFSIFSVYVLTRLIKFTAQE